MAGGLAEADVGALSGFETALLSMGNDLYAIAYTILRDHGEAEDAVQVSLELAWREWGRLRSSAAAKAWLRRICIREAVRSRRRLFNWRRRAELEPRPQALGLEVDIDMARAYDQLTPRQRAVVVLHYRYGYPLDHCAAMIGCRPGTARSHLSRALEKLRKELSDG
jgi:RNA polymerase sigma factor (sigma-70 family)